MMDRATDLMLSKVRHQSLSLRAGNDVKVINVLSVRALFGVLIARRGGQARIGARSPRAGYCRCPDSLAWPVGSLPEVGPAAN